MILKITKLKKSNTIKKKSENNGDIVNLKENGSSKIIINLPNSQKQEAKALKVNNAAIQNLIYNNEKNSIKKSQKPFGT